MTSHDGVWLANEDSPGEIAAAYATGHLRASEAIVLAYARGRTVANNEREGLMIAVGLSPTQVMTYLYDIETEVAIAAVNSPENTTVSGDPVAIKELAKRLSANSIFNRILKTGDNAYHSHHMLRLGESYEELAKQCLHDVEPITLAEPSMPHIKWISSVTPNDEVLSASSKYWRRNLESPVLFSEAVERLAGNNLADLLIEIGPHPALSGPMKQIRSGLAKSAITLPTCLSSLRRGEHDISSMLNLAGSLFLCDAPVDIVAVNATEMVIKGKMHLRHGYPCVDMPQYNFTYPETPLYFENRYSKEFRLRKHPRHDLLGARQPGCSATHPSWRNVIRKKDIPWLDDHKLTPHTVLPAAAYITMAVEAASQIHFEEESPLPIKSFKLRNVTISSTLRVYDDEFGVEVVTDMHKPALGNSNTASVWHKFSIGSISPNTDTWSNHCSGSIMVETRDTTIDVGQRLQLDPRSRSLDMKRWYEKFAEVGLLYGPTFQGLSKLKASPCINAAAADVALNPTSGVMDGGESRYSIHPATLDTCIQLALIACHAGQVEYVQKAFVPIMADSIDIWIPETHEEQGCGVASGQQLGLRSLYARAQLCSRSGPPLLDIGELKCVTYDGSSDATTRNIPREPYWRPVSRVDIDTLTNDSAKSMFPLRKIPPEEFGSYTQLQHLVDLLAHKNPKMRILEINAGTGGATVSILKTLKSNTPFKRYQNFVLGGPDLSQLEYARTDLKGHYGISCQLLDIRKDPIAQGFEPHSFDLIIASRDLGQVSNVSEALIHVHSLLKSKGKLTLTQVAHPPQTTSILGHSIEWNGGHAQISYRENEWDKFLCECGFSGVDISLDDYVKEQTVSTVMLTTASTHAGNYPINGKHEQDLFLVYREYPPPLARSIAKSLSKQGFHVLYTNLHSYHKIPVGSLIISLVDIENITLLHRDETYFQGIQAIIGKNPTILWISAGDHAEPSVMKGMWRSVATENVLLKIVMIEVDRGHLSSLSRTADLISRKFIELRASSPNDSIDLDYVLQDGALYIERFLPDEILNEQFRLRHGPVEDFEESSVEGQGALRANYKQPGLLSSLYFSLDPAFSTPIQNDWVEIKTQAIGLNMKDLVVATAKFDWNYLSTEAAGVVSQVGSTVTSWKVGDRVFGFIPGNMGNYVRSPATLVSKIPEGESFARAASMPVAYLTAIYALKHLAKLSEGESVLIQSATGGLGMAAMRIAKSLGAKIYATVGSDVKRKKLIEEFDIPASQIFHSRDPKTADEIMRATGENGVDVILSNAGGDHMDETLRCTAPLGRFIDVGRTDVIGKGKLSMEVFRRNATLSSFDMGLIYRQKPSLVESLMQELTRLWVDGIISPIDDITTMDISELESAMSFFSRGLHTGKIVVTFQNPEAKLKIARPAGRASFDANAAYLLVGCLGGLGQSLANWMVERGARHLIFLSRSGTGRPNSTLFLDELARFGAKTEIIQCNVTDRDALTSTIERVSNKTLIKGVVHAAMVEGDAFFDKANYSQIHRVLAPKVAGTINLHRATQHLPLDFFLMTSSFIASVGIAAQSAYSAANAFQDAFARFRVSQNLPAISLAIGTVLDVGIISENVNFKQMLLRNGSYGLSETEFLQMLEGALCQPSLPPKHVPELHKLDPCSSGQILLSFEPSRLIPYAAENRINDLVWYNNARFQAIRQSISDRMQEHTTKGTGATGGTSSLSARLKAVDSVEEKTSIVREAIVERLAKLLSIAVDELNADKPLSQYGLDSLVAAELRSWLTKTLGVDITLLDLLSKGKSITDLITTVTEQRH